MGRGGTARVHRGSRDLRHPVCTWFYCGGMVVTVQNLMSGRLADYFDPALPDSAIIAVPNGLLRPKTHRRIDTDSDFSARPGVDPISNFVTGEE